MTAMRVLFVGLTAAALLTTPAIACKSRVGKRNHTVDCCECVAPAIRPVDRAGKSRPRMGNPAASPRGQNCDVGDNPFIC
jgi:hypothetical protein